jgi:hypothetical protein
MPGSTANINSEDYGDAASDEPWATNYYITENYTYSAVSVYHPKYEDN